MILRPPQWLENWAKPDIVSFDFFSKIFGANNISSALDEKKITVQLCGFARQARVWAQTNMLSRLA